MATKKAGGSSKNGRTSNPQYRGIKATHGEYITAGSILVRQLGTKYYPGINTKLGRDYTIYATSSGKVLFSNGFKNRKFINIQSPLDN